MNLDHIKRLLSPLSNRIDSLFTVGVLTRIDPGQKQSGQVELQEDELRDKVKHHMPYGLVYVPMPGAKPMVVALRGDKSGALMIQIQDERYQPADLLPGEVALYDDQAQTVHIARDAIRVKTDKKVLVEAPYAEFSGDVRIKGNVKIDGECVIKQIAFTTHTHGGVKVGTSNSEPPQ